MSFSDLKLIPWSIKLATTTQVCPLLGVLWQPSQEAYTCSQAVSCVNAGAAANCKSSILFHLHILQVLHKSESLCLSRVWRWRKTPGFASDTVLLWVCSVPATRKAWSINSAPHYEWDNATNYSFHVLSYFLQPKKTSVFQVCFSTSDNQPTKHAPTCFLQSYSHC